MNGSHRTVFGLFYSVVLENSLAASVYNGETKSERLIGNFYSIRTYICSKLRYQQ